MRSRPHQRGRVTRSGCIEKLKLRKRHGGDEGFSQRKAAGGEERSLSAGNSPGGNDVDRSGTSFPPRLNSNQVGLQPRRSLKFGRQALAIIRWRGRKNESRKIDWSPGTRSCGSIRIEECRRPRVDE